MIMIHYLKTFLTFSICNLKDTHLMISVSNLKPVLGLKVTGTMLNSLEYNRSFYHLDPEELISTFLDT